MSETIKTGWLEDCNGEKFAPKTLTSQITTNDGVALEQKIESDILNVTNETKIYTDTKIANLINGAPSTLDTLKEIADAMAENESVVDALDEAIGTKANQSELDTHTGNSTIHITASERTNWDAAKTNLDSHLGNTTVHITANERTAWNDANSKKHEHSNKAILDATTESFTTEHKNKIVNLEENATQLGNQMEVLLTSSTQLRNDVDGLNNKINNEISQTTDRTLYGSKAGGIKLIGVKGASEQAVYSGAQLYDVSEAIDSFTVDEDGWITLSYDNTNGTSIAYAKANVKPTNRIEAGKTYRCICEVRNNTSSTLCVVNKQTSTLKGQFATDFNIYNQQTGVFVMDITARSEDDIADALVMTRTLLSVPVGSSASATFRISIIEDTTVTADTFVYEPFVGNAPSPSPSYPQDIESVGDSGSLVVETVGKNRFSGWIMGESVNPNMGGFYPNEKGARTDYIRVNSAEKYTISGLLNAEFGFVAFYDIDKKFITRTGGNSSWGADKLNADRPNECVYIVVSVYENTAVSSFNIANISKEVQIELGTTATEYEPYQGYNTITIPLNEPLRGIGDIKDEVVCKDGVWGVERKIKSVVFDGSSDEKWLIGGTEGGGKRPWIYADCKIPPGNGTVANIRCTHYIRTTASATWYDTEGIAVDTERSIIIHDKDITSLAEWTTWLTENPITVEYELATPTFEPFTDQTPFYGFKSYDTVTYISTDSKVEPSIAVKFGRTEVGATTLLNYNGVKLNEIAIESGDLTFETEDIDFSSEF